MEDAKYLTSVFLFFVDFILSGYDFSVLTPLYVIVTKWFLCNSYFSVILWFVCKRYVSAEHVARDCVCLSKFFSFPHFFRLAGKIHQIHSDFRLELNPKI